MGQGEDCRKAKIRGRIQDARGNECFGKRSWNSSKIDKFYIYLNKKRTDEKSDILLSLYKLNEWIFYLKESSQLNSLLIITRNRLIHTIGEIMHCVILIKSWI